MQSGLLEKFFVNDLAIISIKGVIKESDTQILSDWNADTVIIE